MAAAVSRPYRSIRRGEGLGLLRVHERFAAGGLATVHVGWLVRQERLVAVKRIHPHHVATELQRSRVLDEARAAMRVRHANVVSMLGVVQRPREILAVAEYVPSASLAAIAAERPGPLPTRFAASIAVGMLRGLHAAHAARLGVVPRAVTPGSVLVCEDGRARLLDFDVPDATGTYALADKVPYAAPERLLGWRPDARSDVWSAAVVLWEMLTGRSLFRGANVDGTVRRILGESAPPPSRFAPWVCPSLDRVVLQGLARDANARFASAHAMATEIERWCAPAELVADDFAAMDLACTASRRALAAIVRRREERGGNDLHIECNDVEAKP